MLSPEFDISKRKELFREIELNVLLTELPSDLRDQIKQIFEEPEVTSSYLTTAMNRLKRNLSESSNTENALLVSSLLKTMKREFRKLAPKENFDSTILYLRITLMIAILANLNALVSGDMNDIDISTIRMAYVLYGLSILSLFLSKPKKVDSLDLLRNSLDRFSQNSEE